MGRIIDLNELRTAAENISNESNTQIETLIGIRGPIHNLAEDK